MKTPQVIQDAAANWPEDEAALTAQSFTNRAANGYSADENEAAFDRDTAHMERVFKTEADGAELCARYHAALDKLLPHLSAENLDGFADSADINAHIAKLLAMFPADPVTYISPVPVAYTTYAQRKARAMDCRASGLIEEAQQYELACEGAFHRIPAVWRW